MNPLLSSSGTCFLMNSSSEGRTNSAIIPLFGDFGFLQIWQTSSAMLIGDPAADLSPRQQIFSWSCFTFWNRPYAVVFSNEKWSARVHQQNIQFIFPASEHEQTGTDSASSRFR